MKWEDDQAISNPAPGSEIKEVDAAPSENKEKSRSNLRLTERDYAPKNISRQKTLTMTCTVLLFITVALDDSNALRTRLLEMSPHFPSRHRLWHRPYNISAFHCLLCR